jgi:hypothetical protein
VIGVLAAADCGDNRLPRCDNVQFAIMFVDVLDQGAASMFRLEG